MGRDRTNYQHDFLILEKKGLSLIELELIRNFKGRFPLLDSSSLKDIRLFLILSSLDATDWTEDQKERFILHCYDYGQVVLYNDSLIETIELEELPKGINTALIPSLCDCFGYETIHEVLSNLQFLLEPQDEGFDLLFQSAIEDWMEFISELGVFDRSTPNVEVIRDQLDLDENCYAFLDTEE
jgi:hypothetical protein